MTTAKRLADIVGNTAFDNASQIADAMLAEFVVIPRSDLPKVRSEADVDLKGFTEEQTTETVRADALTLLAYAEHLSGQSATEAKRNARRDELARELSCDAEGFSHDFKPGSGKRRRPRSLTSRPSHLRQWTRGSCGLRVREPELAVLEGREPPRHRRRNQEAGTRMTKPKIRLTEPPTLYRPQVKCGACFVDCTEDGGRGTTVPSAGRNGPTAQARTMTERLTPNGRART